jgi:hypothetical protein
MPTGRKRVKPFPGAPDVAEMIDEGHDPVHATYILIHYFASVFSEKFSRFTELRSYAKEIGSAEEEYMPSGPPMSPLTNSYFSCWAFFDHRIGKTTDTLAEGLARLPETKLGGDQEALRSRWLAPASQVRSRHKLLERVCVPRLQ